jgi:tight adherence protein B
MGVGGVYFWINNKAKKRIEADRGTAARRGRTDGAQLRVGHPFVLGRAHRRPRKSGPAGTELGMIADEAAYGRDVGEALKLDGRAARHAGSCAFSPSP